MEYFLHRYRWLYGIKPNIFCPKCRGVGFLDNLFLGNYGLVVKNKACSVCNRTGIMPVPLSEVY